MSTLLRRPKTLAIIVVAGVVFIVSLAGGALGNEFGGGFLLLANILEVEGIHKIAEGGQALELLLSQRPLLLAALPRDEGRCWRWS